jgi:hypothetical protein
MVFGQEVYVGGSKLSPASAPTSAPNVLIFRRDGAGGKFGVGLRGRNSAGGASVGENDGGACPEGDNRYQCVVARQGHPHEWGRASICT